MTLGYWIAGVYLLASSITFIAYGIDKRRATTGGWRIRERNLHLLELFGGWPGAIAGQACFKHKRHKMSYMLVFGGIVTLHLVLWGIVIWKWR